MYFVHLILRHPELPRPSTADADRVRDLLWDNLHTGSPVEHIRSQVCPHGIDLGMFLRGDISSTEATELILDQYINWLAARLPGWIVAPPIHPAADRPARASFPRAAPPTGRPPTCHETT
jgi:hypothetical protein